MTKITNKKIKKLDIDMAEESSLLDVLSQEDDVKYKNKGEIGLVDSDTQKMIDKYVALKALLDLTKNQEERIKNKLKDMLFEKYIDTMWENKAAPVSSIVSGKKGELTFVVLEKMRVNAKSVEELVRELVELDMPTEHAEKLVENEIVYEKHIGIKSLTELMKGKKNEQKVASKMMKFIDKLSSNEKKLIFTTNLVVNVKKNFLHRLSSYVKNKKQLSNVLNVIKPTHAIRNSKITVNEKDRHDLIVSAADNVADIGLVD